MFILGGKFYIVSFACVYNFAMTNLRIQCCCIKFSFNLDKTIAEIHKLFVQAFSNSALGQTLKMAKHLLMMNVQDNHVEYGIRKCQ